MTPDALPPALPATTDVPLLAGRYQLLDKLGEGGMGAVFRARDAKLDRHVAVKVLPAGKLHDAEAVARFQREARALARLCHPGIIQAYDSGEDGDKHFLVMELVEGRSLAAELADRGRIPPSRAADYAHQAALALQHAHQHGLVHRDVKPSNLLLAAGGCVKLLDLGLARFLQDQIGDGTLTREGVGMGTPDYAAPEQFRDAHRADPRSDVYSLGCTLYHLIAGREPFPGSSLSEKIQAHETKQATPLDELSPDMPAGVALVVQKMTAKRPADRFQSMAEVAQALAPHVAASSPSFRAIRTTSTWDRGKLATMTALPRRRSLAPWLVGGAVAALVLVAAGLLGIAAGWFRADRPQVAVNPDAPAADAGKPTPPAPGAGKTQAPNTSPKQEESKKEPPDPNVLTVSQKEEGGGAYRTIAKALEAVKAGQTIRVLDDSVYHETLTFKGPTTHAGVTLEAVGGAVLERDMPGGPLLYFLGVPRVTVRGLHLRAKQSPRATLIGIRGDCPGLRLESLDLSSDGESTTNGIELLGGDADTDQEPIVIQGCAFRQLGIAANFVGGPTNPVTNVALRDNLFVDCFMGAKIAGRAARVQVVGNRFSGLLLAATQFEILSPDTEDVLVANNTFSNCAAAFRVWDSEVKGKGVRIQNNLLLACQAPDMQFLEAIDANTLRGPGDGAEAAKIYDVGHNWHEGREPTGGNAKAWIPPDPKKGDVLKEKIDGVNRDPKSPDFLRPDKGSPLTTAGAGNEDPSLPRYVGALPLEGADPWDWDRAWRTPKDAQLLTVSKESSGGGKYRTIGDALKDAKPWATIRVLDGEAYEETISLTDRKKHEGLTLEAVKGATLRMPEGVRQLVTIQDVPHVRLSGFTCTDPGGSRDAVRAFVVVCGSLPGVALTRLELIPKSPMLGIVVKNATAGPGEPPLRIEGCAIRPTCPTSNDGISVVGNLDSDPTADLCLRSNRIVSCFRGINLRGALRDIHVTGNLVAKSDACGFQVEDLTPASRGLLFANNTAFACRGAFRIWDNAPYKDPVAGQVEVANNLFFQAGDFDVAYLLNPGMGKEQLPGDGPALVKLWRFHHNRRDFSGQSAYTIPSGADDGRLKRDDLLSEDANEPNRIRPAQDSPLATQGAGTKDGSLPAYIGAQPLEGTPPWDWDRTWRARVQETAGKEQGPN